MMRESLIPHTGGASMGRGLAAILSAAESPGADDIELREVPVELVVPNPRQPRRSVDEDELDRLASSLRERGVLQPVLVRPLPDGAGYELIAGERRWRAARLAGLATVPALVRVHDDVAALELALIENVARADLNPIDEAIACAALVEELGLTHEELGRRTGRSRVAVANLLRLLDLPAEARELLADGTLSAGHGRALLMAAGDTARIALARDAARAGLSVRELERRARAANGAPADDPIRVMRGATGDEGSGAAGDLREQADGARPMAHDEETDAVAAELSAVLGSGVRVRARTGGFRAELDVATLDELRALTRRLRATALLRA